MGAAQVVDHARDLVVVQQQLGQPAGGQAEPLRGRGDLEAAGDQPVDVCVSHLANAARAEELASLYDREYKNILARIAKGETLDLEYEVVRALRAEIET